MFFLDLEIKIKKLEELRRRKEKKESGKKKKKERRRTRDDDRDHVALARVALTPAPSQHKVFF